MVSTQWYGSEAVELTYKDPTGKIGSELLYQHDEERFAIVEEGQPWSLDGAGALFRLVSEAQRIRLAHLFDPVLAVHTSVVDPLLYLISPPKNVADILCGFVHHHEVPAQSGSCGGASICRSKF